MAIPAPHTKVNSLFNRNDERYIKAVDVIQTMKEDLLYILTHKDSDLFASEYIQDRIQMWEDNLKAWDEKHKDD